jgi:Divergent InlB B-repeat domain
MRLIAIAVTCLALGVAACVAVAQGFQAPNIIIKVKGQGLISNNREPGGCETSTCKLVLGKGDKLTLKAKPDPGWAFKRWQGPCVKTFGYKCKIKGSNHRERFVVHFARR